MNQIIIGHVLDVLKGMDSESVHCVVTSPPYCECGCGEPVKGKYRRAGKGGWRTQRFVNPSHSLRLYRHPGATWNGRKHTVDTKQKLSLSRKAFYIANPHAKMIGLANPMFGKNGNLNPNYKTGSSPERQRIYAGAVWKALRKKVFVQWGRFCLDCGHEKDIHLHHIKSWTEYPEFRFDENNVIPLCNRCHYDRHRSQKGVI